MQLTTFVTNNGNVRETLCLGRTVRCSTGSFRKAEETNYLDTLGIGQMDFDWIHRAASLSMDCPDSLHYHLTLSCLLDTC